MNNFKNIYIIIAIILISLVSCENNSKEIYQDLIEENKVLKSDKIISSKELDSLSKNSKICIIDIREESEFILGHIPNAIQIWRPQIQNSEQEELMASKEQLEQLFSVKGISNDDLIVVYDAKGNPDALRLWWILYYYGFDNVKILDGGTLSWGKSNFEFEIGPEKEKTKTDFKFKNDINSQYFASLDMVKMAINDTNFIILDTRTKEEYNGTILKGNAGKAGRIPNSIWIDYADAIDFENDSKFRVLKDLEWNYKTLDKNKTIITYCQSGVRSAHTTFILTEILGFKNVKNYDGSWLEWSNTNEEIEKDSII